MRNRRQSILTNNVLRCQGKPPRILARISVALSLSARGYVPVNLRIVPLPPGKGPASLSRIETMAGSDSVSKRRFWWGTRRTLGKLEKILCNLCHIDLKFGPGGLRNLGRTSEIE